MPMTVRYLRRIVRPWRLFGIVLLAVFLIESMVMALLPRLLPRDSGVGFTALVDSVLLTVVLAPVLWWLIIQPLQILVRVRTQLLHRALSAQEDERARIARDLHDGVGQSLTCLLVGLRATEEMSHEEAVGKQLGELRKVVAATHDEIRRLSRGLRPTVLDDVGLVEALERLCEDVTAASAVHATVHVTGENLGRLPQHLETTCFRVVQEAIANSIRHGGAEKVAVTLHRTVDHVELSIRDNGQGLEEDTAAGETATRDRPGMWSIRERIQLLGGLVHVETKRGEGTIVACRFPIDVEGTEHA
jgi:signal transduction histidine kinase